MQGSQFNPNQPPWQPQPPPQSSYPSPYPGYPPIPTQPPMKPYSTDALNMLISLYALFWLLCFIGLKVVVVYDLGVALCIGIGASLVFLDPRGVISLQARIKPNFFIGVLCFFLWPIWGGIY